MAKKGISYKGKNKEHSFVAYIDESGKDDFNYNSDEWFVLSAFIVRKSDDLNLVKVRDEIAKSINSKDRCIHMKNIRTEDCKRFITKSVGEINNVAFISILANKFYFMDNNKIFDKKDKYYWEVAKYLIERVSQYCSKARGTIQEGNGTVKIIFSNRGGLDYKDFQEYLFQIQRHDYAKKTNEPNKFEDSIKWDAIDIYNVEAMSHKKRAGLQLVDTVAYSFFKSVQKNKFKMVNVEYVKLLKNNTYKSKNGYLGRGIKIIPNPEKLKLECQPIELLEIFK